MHLYYYAAKQSRQAVEYYQSIVALEGVPECIEFEAGEKLSTYSSQPVAGGDVFLLFAADIEDIEYLQRFSEYLEDFLVILILGNANLSLLNKCYGLRPRFVCQGKEDFSLLNQVILKIFAVSMGQACREGPAPVQINKKLSENQSQFHN